MGCLSGEEVVTKEHFRDAKRLELYQELRMGRAAGSAVYLGWALTADGQPRLCSRWMPEDGRRHVARKRQAGAWRFKERQRLAVGIVSSVQTLASQGVTHCDLRLDNFLLDAAEVAGEGKPIALALSLIHI